MADTNTSIPKIPEDVHKLPKTSKVRLSKIAEAETALTFPSPNLRTCIAKCNLALSAFYLKKEVSSFTHNLHFLRQFKFTYFWKLCQAKLQPLTFFNQP